MSERAYKDLICEGRVTLFCNKGQPLECFILCSYCVLFESVYVLSSTVFPLLTWAGDAFHWGQKLNGGQGQRWQHTVRLQSATLFLLVFSVSSLWINSASARISAWQQLLHDSTCTIIKKHVNQGLQTTRTSLVPYTEHQWHQWSEMSAQSPKKQKTTPTQPQCVHLLPGTGVKLLYHQTIQQLHSPHCETPELILNTWLFLNILILIIQF